MNRRKRDNPETLPEYADGNDAPDAGAGDSGQDTMITDHLQYFNLLMRAVQDVQYALLRSDDAGCAAMLTLLSMLPGMVRRQFKDQRALFSTYVARQVHLSSPLLYYVESLSSYRVSIEDAERCHASLLYERDGQPGEYNADYDPKDAARWHRLRPVHQSRASWLGELRVEVGDVLSDVVDALEEAGLLWKARHEQVGGEL